MKDLNFYKLSIKMKQQLAKPLIKCKLLMRLSKLQYTVPKTPCDVIREAPHVGRLRTWNQKELEKNFNLLFCMKSLVTLLCANEVLSIAISR